MDKKSKNNKKGNNPFKRGSTWTFIYYIEDEITGKKKPKWRGGFATKEEAEEELKIVEASLVTGTYIENRKTKLEDYLRHWLNVVHGPTLRPNTYNGYRNNIENHIIPKIGCVAVAKLKRNQVQNFYNYLLYDEEKDLSQSSVRYVHRVLRKAMEDAVNSNLASRNPCSGIKIVKNCEKFKPTVLTDEQVMRLLQVTLGTNIDLEVMMSLTLGLRRGEVLGVRNKDIDYKKRTVTIHQQVTTINDESYRKEHPGAEKWGIAPVKTDEGNRVIGLPQSLMDLMQLRHAMVQTQKLKFGSEYHDNDLLCCKPNGDPMSPTALYRKFKRRIAKSELPDMRFHDLRHTCAYILFDMDTPLKDVSDILGHSSIGITSDTYLTKQSHVDVVAEKMERKLFTLIDPLEKYRGHKKTDDDSAGAIDNPVEPNQSGNTDTILNAG